MRRRTLLASLSPLLGGCLGGNGGSDGGSGSYLLVSEFAASWERVAGPEEGAPRLRFEATPTDDEVRDGDVGSLVLTLANLSETELVVPNEGSPPFGVLWAVQSKVGRTATPRQGSDTPPRFLLWRPYDEEGCAAVRENGRAVTGCSGGEPFRMPAGSSAQRRYELRADSHGMVPGRYVVQSRVRYRGIEEASDSALRFTLQFALRRRRS